MAKQTINVGTAPNDGTGDTLRAAMIKTNDNFTELYNGANINDAAQKTVPIDSDKMAILDSAASYLLKFFTIANLKALLLTYFDTQYADLSDTQNALGNKADLDGSGKVPSHQLPSFVDDVVPVVDYASLPSPGETGKIYITNDDNKTYRWSGLAYVEISASLALGETSSTAYRGDRGKTAYDHSQLVSGNPHNVTKSDVGLGNCDNTSDANKPISDATQDALDLKADLVSGKVPASQLPAYVDDVEEYNEFAALPVTGEAGKIYVTLNDNKTYRWSGSAYVELAGGVALGETSSTAYRGDRGKTAYDFSQVSANKGYEIFLTAGQSNPIDGVTYYFGQVARNIWNSAGASKVYIKKAGKIKFAKIFAHAQTAGSSENISLYIRLNDTTDYLIETVGSATNNREWTNNSLDITVAEGDYFEIKMAGVTWATNPGNICFGGSIYIE